MKIYIQIHQKKGHHQGMFYLPFRHVFGYLGMQKVNEKNTSGKGRNEKSHFEKYREKWRISSS